MPISFLIACIQVLASVLKIKYWLKNSALNWLAPMRRSHDTAINNLILPVIMNVSPLLPKLSAWRDPAHDAFASTQLSFVFIDVHLSQWAECLNMLCSRTEGWFFMMIQGSKMQMDDNRVLPCTMSHQVIRLGQYCLHSLTRPCWGSEHRALSQPYNRWKGLSLSLNLR